jgi:transposase
MLHLHSGTAYYWCQGKTDFRKSFDGLCGLVMLHLQREVTAGGVFIFVNRRRNQIKLLHWEGDGLAIYHKRLEKGFFEEPSYSKDGKAVLIDAEKLQLILQGIVLKSVIKRKRYTHNSSYPQIKNDS